MHDSKNYSLSDFDFELPEELIAQYPTEHRAESRLFHLRRNPSLFEHLHFHDISRLLHEGDMLVCNNAKVIPARMYFKRESGACIEVVLVRQLSLREWLIITNRTKRLKPGTIISSIADTNICFEIIERVDEYLKVRTNLELSSDVLERIGMTPLPSYIKRDASDIDRERYQTVYASQDGAVAAPTAGLHFTDALLSKLQKQGISIEYLTLYVSWGTFRPVRSERLEHHDMHSEHYTLSEKVAGSINTARKEGRRIIAVGTTSLRVLESTYHDGRNIPGSGETNIFIYPPYRIASIDALITNLHTPKSTLLMLVAAFTGYTLLMGAYREAVVQQYRFFSYGDAMFVE